MTTDEPVTLTMREMIRVMVLPTALFSTAQLAATILHWDKFTVDSTPFYVWLASYVLPPPIFMGNAMTNAPVTGSLSSCATFSNAGTFEAKSRRWTTYVVDCP